MYLFLKLSRLIDLINTAIGKSLIWLVLAATLISAGNAVVRRAFGYSSNAFLEVQWYLFAAVFLLGGGYAFLLNAHVRVDFLASRFSARGRSWVDIVGILVFLLPLCYLMASLAWPTFYRAWMTGELSSNAGGLLRWPAYALIPIGFFLLSLQGVSEVVKRLNFLYFGGVDSLAVTGPSDEEVLAQDLLRDEQAQGAENIGFKGN